ncbi:MAG: hypothetical protein JO019_01230 [Candidatus Kaiserbacteria bacterium]|nr:hypothetical protein [Candidatus Kaiserbacteria bacterium]
MPRSTCTGDEHQYYGASYTLGKNHISMMTDDEHKRDDEETELSEHALGETFDEEVDDDEEEETPGGLDEFGGGDGEEKQWE